MNPFSLGFAILLFMQCVINYNQVYAYVNKKEPWQITQLSSRFFYNWQPKLGVGYYILCAVAMLFMWFTAGVADNVIVFGALQLDMITTVFAWFVLARKSAHRQEQLRMNAVGPQGTVSPPAIPQ